MCEADAYMVHENQEQMIMSSVNVVQPEGENAWRLVNIFGEQKTIRGRNKSMRLVNHRIIFEPLPPQAPANTP